MNVVTESAPSYFQNSRFIACDQSFQRWNQWGVSLISWKTWYMAPIGMVVITASTFLRVVIRGFMLIEESFSRLRDCWGLCRKKSQGVLEKVTRGGNTDLVKHIFSFLPFSEQANAVVTRSDKFMFEKLLSETTSLKLKCRTFMPSLYDWHRRAPNLRTLTLQTVDQDVYVWRNGLQSFPKDLPNLVTLIFRGRFVFIKSALDPLRELPHFRALEIGSRLSESWVIKDVINIPRLQDFTIECSSSQKASNLQRAANLPPLRAFNVRVVFNNTDDLPHLEKIAQLPGLTRLEISSWQIKDCVQYLHTLRESCGLKPLTIEWIRSPVIA